MRRSLMMLSTLLVLAGCTDADWDRNLNYVGIGQGAPAQPVARADMRAPVAARAPAPMPVAQPAPVAMQDPFCQSVATEDSQGNGFDAPTQSRVYQASYNQCVALFRSR